MDGKKNQTTSKTDAPACLSTSASLLSLLLFHRIAPRAHRFLPRQIEIRPVGALSDQKQRGRNKDQELQNQNEHLFVFFSFFSVASASSSQNEIYLSLILLRRLCSASWCLDAYVVDMRDSPERVRVPTPLAAAAPAVRGAAGAEAAVAAVSRCTGSKSAGGTAAAAAAAAAACCGIPLAVPWGATS